MDNDVAWMWNRQVLRMDLWVNGHGRKEVKK